MEGRAVYWPNDKSELQGGRGSYEILNASSESLDRSRNRPKVDTAAARLTLGEVTGLGVSTEMEGAVGEFVLLAEVDGTRRREEERDPDNAASVKSSVLSEDSSLDDSDENRE